MAGTPRTRYAAPAIALHWIIAALMAVALPLGLYMHELKLSPLKLQLYSYHKWIGVTVFALAALRLAWRLVQSPPPALPMTAWQARVAMLAHGALYVLMFAIPLTGWLHSSATGVPTVYLGLWQLPDLVSASKPLARTLREIHAALGNALLAVVALHVAAALKHHWVDRDDTLWRMWPWVARRGTGVSVCLLLCALLLSPLDAMAAPIDATRSTVTFAGKQMGVPVEGLFRRVSGNLDWNAARPEQSRVQVEVDLTSIDLGEPQFNAELQGRSFFDTVPFPKATFTSVSMKPLGGGRFEVSGRLAIKGVARDLVAPVTVREDGGQRIFEAVFPIRRLDYRIGEGEWSDQKTLANEVQVRVRLVTAR
jgi:cytochrome b561